jgi:antitoxin VapB
MAFHVRGGETDALVRELARREGVGLTEAVKLAVREKLQSRAKQVPLRDRLKKIADRLDAYPDTGVTIDKAFYDDLSGV